MDGDIAAESVGVLIAVGSAAFAATYKVSYSCSEVVEREGREKKRERR